MAEKYVFPTIQKPKIPYASNAGDSYKESIQDSTITITSDANYKHTRPRTTRMIHSWTYVWTALSKSDYARLKSFWEQVGTFQSFEWAEPDTGEKHIVRFSGTFEWQENYPVGYQGKLTFEEV